MKANFNKIKFLQGYIGFILILMLAATHSLHAQRDSLLNAYQSAPTPQERLEALDKLVVYSVFESPDYLKGKPYADEFLKLATNLKDTLKMARANNALGTFYLKITELDKSIAAYQQALIYAQAIHNYQYATTLLSNLSNTYMDKNDVTKSYQLCIAAYETSKKCDCPKAKDKACRGLGFFYYNTLQDYKTTIYWYKESLQYGSSNIYEKSLTYYLLFSSYLELNQLDSAKHYCSISLTACEQADRKDVLVWTLSDQAIMESKQGHHEVALKMAQKAISMAQQVEPFDQGCAYYCLAYVYYNANDYPNARKALAQTEALVLTLPAFSKSPFQLEVYDLFVKLEGDRDPKKALEYLKKATNLRATINQAIFDTRSEVFAFQSNIVLQETENKRLQLENEKKSQTTKFLQFILISISIFLFIVFYFYQKIRRQNTELQNLTHRMQHFCNTLSHDALGYINQIIGFANFAQGSTDIAESRLMNQKVIQKASRLKKMSKNLIEFNETGHIPDMKSVSLDYILVEVKEDMESEFANEDKTLNIQTHLPVVKADREFMKQIFRNLIGNAIKYGKPNEPMIVEVFATLKKDTVEIGVKDNGTGIFADDIPHLFKEFTQGANPTEGSGLGLYICKQFVEKMGGQIWVESALGKGTTFFFTLPL
jgi:signal transduction histidine kinase